MRLAASPTDEASRFCSPSTIGQVLLSYNQRFQRNRIRTRKAGSRWLPAPGRR